MKPDATENPIIGFICLMKNVSNPSVKKKNQRTKQLSNSLIFKVGVTGFEPATTRPLPKLNFTFSNKFNELYSSGFYTHSESCSLPLSGVVAISRVPPVFHASFPTRSKLKSESPAFRMPGIIHSDNRPKIPISDRGP